MSDTKGNLNDTTTEEPQSDEMWHVKIPDHIGSKIEYRIAETMFDSVDEYVTFVLESLLREIDKQNDDRLPDTRETTAPDNEDTDKMQNRLEALGYL